MSDYEGVNMDNGELTVSVLKLIEAVAGLRVQINNGISTKVTETHTDMKELKDKFNEFMNHRAQTCPVSLQKHATISLQKDVAYINELEKKLKIAKWGLVVAALSLMTTWVALYLTMGG